MNKEVWVKRKGEDSFSPFRIRGTPIRIRDSHIIEDLTRKLNRFSTQEGGTGNIYEVRHVSS